MTARQNATIPPDDPNRSLGFKRPDSDESLPHVCVVGDTYTVLLSGRDTAGRFTLIDMYIPPSGGPPPHRHDFEELFMVLDGEVEFTFRGEKITVRAGEVINIPANAPHNFRNSSDRATRMYCMCTPPGQEEFFLAIGDRVPTRTSPPPKLSSEEQQHRKDLTLQLAPEYRTELLV